MCALLVSFILGYDSVKIIEIDPRFDQVTVHFYGPQLKCS